MDIGKEIKCNKHVLEKNNTKAEWKRERKKVARRKKLLRKFMLASEKNVFNSAA